MSSADRFNSTGGGHVPETVCGFNDNGTAVGDKDGLGGNFKPLGDSKGTGGLEAVVVEQEAVPTHVISLTVGLTPPGPYDSVTDGVTVVAGLELVLVLGLEPVLVLGLVVTGGYVCDCGPV
jgi:hypothetical protein